MKVLIVSPEGFRSMNVVSCSLFFMLTLARGIGTLFEKLTPEKGG